MWPSPVWHALALLAASLALRALLALSLAPRLLLLLPQTNCPAPPCTRGMHGRPALGPRHLPACAARAKRARPAPRPSSLSRCGRPPCGWALRAACSWPCCCTWGSRAPSSSASREPAGGQGGRHEGRHGRFGREGGLWQAAAMKCGKRGGSSRQRRVGGWVGCHRGPTPSSTANCVSSICMMAGRRAGWAAAADASSGTMHARAKEHFRPPAHPPTLLAGL